jgi:DnaJ-class molecular chaperone
VGDFYLELEVREHPTLTRDGLDLELEVPIRVDEAILGSEVRIPTPHGDVDVDVPAGISSGATLRLEGLGVRREHERGDLYAVLEIHTPDVVDGEIELAAERLADGYSTSPREELDL